MRWRGTTEIEGRSMTGPTSLACLTPPGTGAIATLALHGPTAWPALEQLFQPASGKPSAIFLNHLRQQEPIGQFWLGRLGEAERGFDEVVLALRQVRPVPSFEIHCHGGRQVVALLERAFAARGVQLETPDELFRQRGEKAEACFLRTALTQAPTLRTASLLLDQYHGAFRREVAALLELEAQDLLTRLERLHNLLPLGRHLTQPWRVAVVGPPNVGKSSLVNALAGFQRCVVSPVPGTTRDVVSTRLAIDGWPVEFLDTAGVRSGLSELESAGIVLGQQAAASADLCLWVVDASLPPVRPPPEVPNVRMVVNKSDLPAAWDVGEGGEAPRISATTGAGLEQLCLALSHWLVPNPPQPGEALPCTPAQQLGIVRAWTACREGRIVEAKNWLRQAVEDTPAQG